MTFNITYDSSVTSQTNAAQIETAFGVATQTLQALYTNSSSVNITVYWGAVGPFSGGIALGRNQSQAIGYYTYVQLTNALRATRTTLADSNAVASLPANDPVAGNQWIMSQAEAKALGLSTIYSLAVNDSATSDGDVGFAFDVGYNFNPTNRAAVFTNYDFIAVAEHEITEVMGRDNFGLNLNDNYVPYDLFRFTASGVRSFNVNDSNVYFSDDNGATVLKYFYGDVNTGDIQDWAGDTAPDAYDAYLSNGQVGRLSFADLTALDIIGYKLNFSAPRLTGAALANGNFKVSFTNVTGLNFVVQTTTNLSLSTSNWTNLGTPIESPAGQYQFTDTHASNARFYRVSLP
ncbi:MAG TPA: NF038122 family metalloprotease [Verrucomicrobiae bacterium]